MSDWMVAVLILVTGAVVSAVSVAAWLLHEARRPPPRTRPITPADSVDFDLWWRELTGDQR